MFLLASISKNVLHKDHVCQRTAFASLSDVLFGGGSKARVWPTWSLSQTVLDIGAKPSAHVICVSHHSFEQILYSISKLQQHDPHWYPKVSDSIHIYDQIGIQALRICHLCSTVFCRSYVKPSRILFHNFATLQVHGLF